VPIHFAVEVIQRDPKVRRSILWYEERVLERWRDEREAPSAGSVPGETERHRQLAEVVGVPALDAKDRAFCRRMLAEGVPVELMIDAVREVRRRRAEQGLEAAFTLRWYRWDIHRRWQEHQRVQAPGWMPESEAPPPVADSLEGLVALLPSDLPERELWGERIRGLDSGDDSFVELDRALGTLDRLLLDELWSQADPDLRGSVEESLGEAERKMGLMLVEDRERLHEQIRDQLVRDRYGAPVLSLYSVAGWA
jgi:hypothetical protein